MNEVFNKHITLYDWQDFCYRHESCYKCSLLGCCRLNPNPRAWNIEDMEDKIRAGFKEPKRILSYDDVISIIEGVDEISEEHKTLLKNLMWEEAEEQE